jgi:hypothetical protein
MYPTPIHEMNGITELAENKFGKGSLLHGTSFNDCRKCALRVATELMLHYNVSDHFSGDFCVINACKINSEFRNEPWEQGSVECLHMNMTSDHIKRVRT